MPLVLYALAAALIVAPSLLAGMIVGDPQTDALKFYWGFWWFGHALFVEHRLPFDTDLLKFPEGGYLYFIDPLNASLSLLLGFLPLPARYNLIVGAEMVLAAWAACLLASALLKNRGAGLVAGAMFGFSPYVLGCIHCGNTGTASVGWIPLSLYAFWQGLRTGRRRWGVLAAVAFACAFACSFYYGAALFVAYVAAAWVLRKRLLDAAAIAGLSLALAAPVALALVLSIATSHAAIENRASLGLDVVLGNLRDSDIVGFVWPGRWHLNAFETEGRFLQVTFLGFLPLLLALCGATRWLHRRRPPRSLVLAALWFGVFTVMAMGLFLVVGGRMPALFGRPFPLPYLLFFRFVPGASELILPYRYVAPASLALAILAGYGATVLMRRVPQALRRGAWTGLALLAIADSLAFSPTGYPLSASSVQTPPLYARIAAQPEKRAVLDLPVLGVHGEEGTKGLYYLYQTVHHQPIPYYINTFVPNYMTQNDFTRELFKIEQASGRYAGRPQDQALLKTGLQRLRADGFGWIVLHLDNTPKGVRQPMEDFLTGSLGPPEGTDILKYWRL